MIITSADAGLFPGNDIAVKLNELIASMQGNDEEKTVNFAPGTYYLDAKNCPEEKYYPTNTIGDNEYKSGEKPHYHKIGIHIKNIKNLTLSGDKAVFVARGRMTNVIVSGCENITLDGIEFRAENPDVHEFEVIKSGLFSATLRLDEESTYIEENGKYYFTGSDYKTPFMTKAITWPYYTHFSGADKNRVKRSAHPLFGALSVKETAKRVFSVRYLSPKKNLNTGDVISVYDVRRLDCGIFVENTINITVKNVKQRFNVSLAFVAQNTENITVHNVDFCAAEGQAKKLVSYADFIQVCMCKGLVSVTDSRFAGAGDDVLNVHGTHFKITSVDGNKIVCRFEHPQSHGYLAFNSGDKLEFIEGSSLAKKGEATVTDAKMKDEYNIELTVDSAADAKPGLFIENVTLCPDLYFAGNHMSQIVTRGLLITTRGKVTVENNVFENTVMPSLLFSDDAKSWYESGPCRDVTIRNNIFNECDECYIRILPENGSNTNAVHGKFVVEGNTFLHNRGIEAKNCESLVLKDNIYKEKKDGFLRLKGVREVVDD